MRLLLAVPAVAGLVLLTAWWFEMPLARAAIAAPIIVLSVGAAVGLVVLWTKVIVESLRAGGASPRSPEPGPGPEGRTPTAS